MGKICQKASGCDLCISELNIWNFAYVLSLIDTLVIPTKSDEETFMFSEKLDFIYEKCKRKKLGFSFLLWNYRTKENEKISTHL